MEQELIKTEEIKREFMKKKILFVFRNPLGIPYYDMGIASLSGQLKKAGHDVCLVDFTFGLKDNKGIKIIKNQNPDIICFALRSNEKEDVINFVNKIKEQKINIPTLAGGSYPTVDPNDAIKYFDAICIGEAEEAIIDFVNNLDKNNIKNFWYNKDGEIIKNGIRPLINNLDLLAWYDLKIFDIEKYIKAKHGELEFITQKGCPYKCSYCIHNFFHKINEGKPLKMRYYSAEKIVPLMAEACKKYKVKRIKFNDDIFNMYHPRLKKFCELYTKEIGLPFECSMRVDLCTKEMFTWLKMANCQKVEMAIESGDFEMRKKIQKPITDEQIINAFRWAKEAGVPTMSLNMVGLPLETKEQIQKSIDLNRKVQPDYIQVSIFTPYYGTDLYDFSVENNLLKTNKIDISYYMGDYLYNPNITSKELQKIRKTFAYKSFKDRSLFKAYMLLIREYATPHYLRHGRIIPLWVKNMIYMMFWTFKPLKFMSK